MQNRIIELKMGMIWIKLGGETLFLSEKWGWGCEKTTENDQNDTRNDTNHTRNDQKMTRNDQK